MHLEDAPAGAAEAVAAEAEHGGLLRVALQIESRAPSNPLRTHKRKRRAGDDGTRREGGRGRKVVMALVYAASLGRSAVTAITPNGASDRGQFNLSVYKGREPSNGLARNLGLVNSPMRSHATCRIPNRESKGGVCIAM